MFRFTTPKPRHLRTGADASALEKAKLDPIEARFARAILEAISAIRSKTKRAEVQALIAAGDLDGALRAIEWTAGDAILRGRVPKEYRDMFEAGALAEERKLRRIRELDASGLRFDLTNPAATEWVRTRSGELIREFNASSIDAVRDIMRRAFEDGIPPKKAAGMILDSGIGLTAKQAASVERFRRRLEDASDIDLSDAQITSRTERYYRRFLRRRAETIARTETIMASTKGAQELWRQAAQGGLVDPSRAEQEWIVSFDDRLCPICEPLDGERAPLGGAFPGGFTGPPAHPACRCAVALRPGGVGR